MTKPYETRGRAARSRRSSSMQAQAQGPFPEALRFAPGSYKVNTGPDSAPEAMWSHRSIALAPKRQTSSRTKKPVYQDYKEVVEQESKKTIPVWP